MRRQMRSETDVLYRDSDPNREPRAIQQPRRTLDVTPYLPFPPRPPRGRPTLLLWDRDGVSTAAPAIEFLRSQGLIVARRDLMQPLAATLTQIEPDLVVVDLTDNMLQVCREIADSGRRLVVYSDRSEPLDQVAALESGADDYIQKCAHPLVLLARVRAVLRRGAARPSLPAATESAGQAVWQLDRRHGILSGPGGASVRLNRSSTELLWMLSQRPRTLIQRAEIATALFAPGPLPDSRALDVRVYRLRRALDSCGAGGALIRTFQGIGFALDAEVTTSGETVLLRDARPAS